MQSDKIEIFIADDTAPFLTALRQIVRLDPGMKIVGSAKSGTEAEEKIQDLLPDVIILNGLAENPENLRKLVANLRRVSRAPAVAVVRQETEPFPASGFDTVRMPDLSRNGSARVFANEMCVKIKLAAQSAPSAHSGKIARRFHVIAIGASTGGTEATAEILARLPADMPGIVIVQHMPAEFTKMYAARLNRISHLSVSEAEDRARVEEGTVLVAPGGLQMHLRKDARGYYVVCRGEDKVNGHCPSVGVLFDSVAQTAGADAIGVILTGMGRDGAEALLRMRKAGAFTVGQDESSCVVYGMPMAAFEIGAVVRQASPSGIAGILTNKA